MYALISLLAGCAPKPTLECGTNVSLEVLDADADGTVRADLPVRGTATHPGGLAIREVLVGGVRASNDGFNFDAWSASIPIQTLVARAEADASLADGLGRAVLPVTAVDACGEQTELTDGVEVVVDLTPETVITQGALRVRWGPADGEAAAGPDDYLPADGSELALLEICAPADAVGVEVALSSDQGGFVGTDAGRVGLAAGACAFEGTDAAAVARAWFAPETDASTAFVSVAGGDATGAVAIDVAGAPTLVPASATLASGQRVVVQALSDGVLARCAAYGADPTTLTVGPSDASASLYDGYDVEGASLGEDLELVVHAAGSAAATVSVVCCDTYDQCSTAGTYTLAAP